MKFSGIFIHGIISKLKKLNGIINNKQFINISMQIVHFIHGIESGYKICCIISFLKDYDYNVPHIEHVLCYKHYKKVLN
ncbi:hypothetical protein LCGC14_2286240 [marine sediment metagenome]|uniref:Uncharacterized protein n=1 Tax=marine sediment metagenome TaxID=412755 RepID=A0A0F9F567_9ZZZZ